MLRWLTIFIALLAIPSSLQTAGDSVAEQVVESEQFLLPTVSYPDTGKRSLLELSDALPLVELRGDPSNLQISGLDRITTDQLQSALAFDLEFQDAARQTASLADFIDTLENRIKVGFLHSGFPNASVAVDFRAESGKIHVFVTEGELFENGNILVSGANGLGAIELANAIRTPTEKRPWIYTYGKPKNTTSEDDSLKTPAWEIGAVTQFNEDSIKRLATRIRELMTDQGFPFAQFKIKLLPEDDGKTSLLVNIADPGPRAQLSNVRFKGLQRHSEEQLLSYLGIEKGTSLNRVVLRDIYLKLRESCRFWSYGVLVKLPSLDSRRYVQDTDEVELVISLAEYPHVPPLGEPLPEADETMMRAAQWLESYVTRGDTEAGDLVIEIAENPREDIEKPTGLLGKIVLSPQQGIAVDVYFPENDLIALWHSLVTEQDTIVVFDWRQKKKLRAPLGNLSVTINISWGTGEFVDGEYKNKLVFGFGTKTSEVNAIKQALSFTMECEPVAFVNLLHRDGATYELGNDVLKVHTRGLEFRIDKKNGRVVQIAFDNPDRMTNATGTFSFQKNAFKEHVNQIRSQEELFVDRYDTQRPITSCTKFALKQLNEQPIFENEPLFRLISRQLLRSLDSGWLDELASDMSWSEFITKKRFSRQAKKYGIAFSIPTSDLQHESDFDDFRMLLVRVAVPMTDCLFPRGSWPWTFTREASLSMASKQQSESLMRGRDAELWATMRNGQTGILGHALVALLWEEFMPSAFSKKIAKHAHSKLNDASFVSDIQYFIRGDYWSAQIAMQLVETIDELSDLEKKQFRESLSPFLATAFDSLIARRQSHPQEAEADALEGVLVELWRSDWRDMLSERLGNVTAEVQISEQPLSKVAP